MSNGISTTDQGALTQSSPDEPRLSTQARFQNHDHLERQSRPEIESTLSTEIRDAQSHNQYHGDGSLERSQTARDDRNYDVPIEPIATTASGAIPIYSVFSRNQKRFIVFMAAWAGFFSPVSGNIYFPALNPLAEDLNVSNTLINLTLTSYMVCHRQNTNRNIIAPILTMILAQIFQGLAPSFFGDFADIAGRRPAYAGKLTSSTPKIYCPD